MLFIHMFSDFCIFTSKKHMHYNFDEIIDRKNTACYKYDLREKYFKKPDILPMWVADMDFRTPDFVLNAIQEADPNDQSVKPVPYSGIQYVGIPEFPAIGAQIGEEIVKLLNDEITLDEALENAQLIAEKQMKASGYIEK